VKRPFSGVFHGWRILLGKREHPIVNIAPTCSHTHTHHTHRPSQTFEHVSNESLSDETLKDLFQSAVMARDKAYAPNSQFKVGAAILARDGSVYQGSNKELTINADHAEQRAINQALMGGQKPKDLLAVAVFGARGPVNESHFEKRLSPCGNCRQALHELNPDMLAVGADGPGKVQANAIKNELPDAYYREKELPSPPAAVKTGDPLVDGALVGRSKSFVPRSQQPVGAAVETDKGIFVGTQAEVSSFASQAARMALGAAMEAGATVFHRMALVAGTTPEKFEKPQGLPFDTFEALYKLSPQAEVVMPDKNGKMVTYQAQEFPGFLVG
jgi:cytidine deaminase